MQEDAERVLRQALAEFEISHVVAAFSGGDDSIVSTHWAMNRFNDALVMIADTQIGVEPTRQHQKHVVQQQGWAAARVSPQPEGPPPDWQPEWIDGETSYEEFVLNHGFPGNGQHPRMYQRLKQRAFRRIKPLLGKRKRGTRILVISGIRASESAIRAGYKRAFAEESTEAFVWLNPFYHATAADFEAYRQEFGLPRNPVSPVLGFSGECCCGAHASQGERQRYRLVDEEFAEYLNTLEQRVMVRFPWPWGCKPPVWWRAEKRIEKERQQGQRLLCDDVPTFMPACVGCGRKGL